MVTYILVGMLAVGNMVLWGLYGDLLAEKFEGRKIARSLAIGFFWSILLYIYYPHSPLFLIALMTIALERGTTEIYKALLREESQQKYKIPSNLGIHTSPLAKKVIGGVLLVSLCGTLAVKGINLSPWIVIIAAGFTTAIGGMLKDAPHEGFEPLKFLRSPIVALLVGTIILTLFPETTTFELLGSVFGGERIISECYKKILHGRIPGKFKTHTYNQRWSQHRVNILPVYVTNIIMLLSLLLIN